MIILYQEIFFLQFYFQGLFSWTSFWPDFLGDSVYYMSANTHDHVLRLMKTPTTVPL